MAEVEQADHDVQTTPKTRGRGQKRTRYYKNHVSKQVVTLSMPARCPEEAPNCTEVHTIRLYIGDRQQVWLDLADVEWAVRFLYVQNLFKGVPLIPGDSTGPASWIHGNGDNWGEDIRMCSETIMCNCILNTFLESMVMEMSGARV